MRILISTVCILLSAAVSYSPAFASASSPKRALASACSDSELDDTMNAMSEDLTCVEMAVCKDEPSCRHKVACQKSAKCMQNQPIDCKAISTDETKFQVDASKAQACLMSQKVDQGIASADFAQLNAAIEKTVNAIKVSDQSAAVAGAIAIEAAQAKGHRDLK